MIAKFSTYRWLCQNMQHVFCQMPPFRVGNQRFCSAKQHNGQNPLALRRFLPISDFIAKFALDGGKCAATH